MKKHLLIITLFSSIITLGQQYIQDSPPVKNSVDWRSDYDLIESYEYNAGNDLSQFDLKNTVRVYPNDMPYYVMRSDNVELTVDSDQEGTIGVMKVATKKETDYYHPWIWQAKPTNNYSDIYPNENNDGEGYPFKMSSGQATTKSKYLYGYFEIRAKISKGTRMWPAFWLFGHTDGLEGTLFPNKTEIDMFEIFPGEQNANEITSNLHYTVITQNNNNEDIANFLDQYNIQKGWNSTFNNYKIENLAGEEMRPFIADQVDISSQYNTYGIEWESDHITWYFNNKPFLTITNPSVLSKFNQHMAINLSSEVKYSGADWDLILETLSDENLFLIDYLRIYKKKPTVIVSNSNCKSGPMTYTYIPTIGSNYNWTISPVNGATTSVQDNQITVQLNNPNTSILLTLTENTDTKQQQNLINGSVSSFATIKTAAVKPKPEILKMYCHSNGSMAVDLNDNSFSNGAWYIFNSDENHTVGSAQIQPTIYGQTATFSGLIYGNWYYVKRGTFDACHNWNEEKIFFKIEISGDISKDSYCSINGVDAKFNAPLNTGLSHQWLLKEQNGTWGNSTWSDEVIYTNLNKGNSYQLKHGVYGGLCNVSWTEEIIDFVVPSYDLNPDMKYKAVNYKKLDESNKNLHKATIDFKAIHPDGNHYWVVYDVDQSDIFNHDFWTEIKLNQYTTEFSTPDLSFENFYVLKHGVYGECSLWNEKKFLIYLERFDDASWFRSSGENSDVNIISFDEELSLEEKQKLTVSRTNEYYEVRDSESKVFPNPALERITVLNDKYFLKEVKIFDTSLKLVKTITNINSKMTIIELSGLSTGVYFAVVETEGDSQNLKFIIR